MPLSMVKEGEPSIIKKVGGKEETRKFLENLGFVTHWSNGHSDLRHRWQCDCEY